MDNWQHKVHKTKKTKTKHYTKKNSLRFVKLSGNQGTIYPQNYHTIITTTELKKGCLVILNMGRYGMGR